MSDDDKQIESQEMPEKRWYVVQAMVGYEKKIVERLHEAVELHGLEDLFGEVLVPTEEVIEMRGTKKIRSERKFYPGYVLVNMALTDEAWYLVRKLPKVLGFVGGARPAPITEKEADAIMSRMKEGADKPKPKVMFEAGEVIRICDGPFNDFDGVVKEVDYEKNKIKAEVSIFGRPTPVELDYSQVEKT